MKKLFTTIAILTLAGTLMNAQELNADDYVPVEITNPEAPGEKIIVLVEKEKLQEKGPWARSPEAIAAEKYNQQRHQEKLARERELQRQREEIEARERAERERREAESAREIAEIQRKQSERTKNREGNTRNPSHNISLEGFYAKASASGVDFPDLRGAWLSAYQSIPVDKNLAIDIGFVMAWGFGDESYNDDGVKEKDKQRENLYGLRAGIRSELTENLSLSLGGMFGLDMRHLEVELRDYGYYEHEKADDWGVFYGFYAQADIKLNKNCALTAAFRYIKTDVESDFGDWGKIDEDVKYSIFSAGLKFTF